MFITLLIVAKIIYIYIFFTLEAVHSSSGFGDIDIEINQCAAYDVPSLIQQKVFMENNPAYEEIKSRCTSS